MTPARPAQILAVAMLLVACTHSARGSTPTTSRTPLPTRSVGAGTTTSSEPASGYLPFAVPPPEASPTCEVAVKMHDTAALVGAFLAARVKGAGAESCLTSTALAEFSDRSCDDRSLLSAPGPIVLYRCGPHRITGFSQIEVSRLDANYIQLQADLSGTDPSGFRPYTLDHLTIGHGTPVGSARSAEQVITDDSSL